VAANLGTPVHLDELYEYDALGILPLIRRRK